MLPVLVLLVLSLPVVVPVLCLVYVLTLPWRNRRARMRRADRAERERGTVARAAAPPRRPARAVRDPGMASRHARRV
jgi:hypothetical protein